MYGFIPAAALEFVRQLPNGEELLDEISRRLDGTINTNFYTQYQDKETLNVLKTVADVTNMPMEDLLSNMGSVQLGQFEAKGYGPLIRSLGSTFYEFLEHLDALHMNLVHSYPNMKAPSFRPERMPDGRVLLHYYSGRPGLHPYATALLESIARELFGQSVHFQHVQKKQSGHDHDIFEVVADMGITEKTRAHETANRKLITCDASREEFDALFPWHVQFDTKMNVVSMGSSLALRFGEKDLKGQLRFTDIAKVTRPSLVRTDFEQLRKYDQTSVMLLVRDEWYHQLKQSKLDEKKMRKLMRTNTSLADFDGAMQSQANLSSFGNLASASNLASAMNNASTANLSLAAESGCPFQAAGGSAATASSPHPSMPKLRRQQTTSQDKLASLPSTSSPKQNGSVRRTRPRARNGSTGSNTLAPPDTANGNPVRFRSDSVFSTGSAVSASFAEQYIVQTADFLYLQGEFRYIEKSNTLLFVGVPAAQTPDELYRCGLGLTDIPVHSNGREMLFNNVHQSATVNVAAKLEQVTQDLEQARRELSLEKRKVHELLSSILPQSVIQYLAQGDEAPAERFNNVSILFSDIVSFTKISSAVRPTQVMDMLNDLFLRFDKLCEKHGVYKVETIGDAYMVASGLPETSPDHAERLCRFAIDMMRASRDVMSPVDGKPLRMRIGLHSGSVMAGVVGQTRPRYCLFGDAVSVAAQMESSGVPRCIQISASMMSELRAAGAAVQVQPRGDIELKGRGLMQTFLLVGMDSVDETLVPEDSTSSGGPDATQLPALPSADGVSGVLALLSQQQQQQQQQHQQQQQQKQPTEPALYQVLVQSSDGRGTTLLGVQDDMTLGDVAAIAKQEIGLSTPRLSIFADEAQQRMLLLCQTLRTAIRSGAVATRASGSKGVQGGMDEVLLFVQ